MPSLPDHRSRFLTRLLPATWLAALLLCAAAGARAQSEEQARPDEPGIPLFAGAAHLFNLDQVSVIYPAGPGQDVDLHRRVAERCAAYLTREFGVDAEPAPDMPFDEDLRNGNLLLLGWNNRLLGTKQAPTPFARSGDRRRFLGGISVRGDEDLLFASASPYNPDRLLVFWSRLDLERSRFQVLPFVGSDFAVYRDFAVVHQGMFEDRLAWPPKRNEMAERDRRDELFKPPREIARSKRFVLHGTIDESEAREILERREQALSRAVAALGDPGEQFSITLYVYADSADKERRTGVPDESHSIPSRHEIHATMRAARSASPREEVHVLAHRRLGPCIWTALYEGLAVAVSLPDDPGGLPVYAALLLEHDALPTIEELLDEETMRKAIRERSGMTAAGLLVAWLREKGGDPLLARAYTRTGLDTARLAQWLELPVGELDARFREWVVALSGNAENELGFRMAEAEAREYREREDHAAAAAALQRALKYKPADPATLYKLALAQIESDQSADARRSLEQLVGLEVGPGESRYVIFGHHQLGLLLRGLGQEDLAAAQLRRVLELPDQFEAHRMAREALETGSE